MRVGAIYVRKMKRICNDASNCILYFLQAMTRIFRNVIKDSITKILTGMNKSISKCDSTSFRNKWKNATQITELKEAIFNNRWDVYIHGLSVWKIGPRFFALSLGDIVLEPKLIILTGRFTLFGLNRRYSVLCGLTDNLFNVIHENTSQI